MNIDKSEHRRVLELLDAVTIARDRAEAEANRLREDRNLEKRMRKDAEIEREIFHAECKRAQDVAASVLDARDALALLNKRLAADLNTALARCAELEHHLSPAPNGATREPSEGERGKSQVPQNAVAGEETLGMTYEIRIPNQQPK